MPRNAVYLLVTGVGPTADEQIALIQKRVPIGPRDQTYTDDVTVKYRRRDRPLEQRDMMMRQLRKGDVVVVASPGCLGRGRDDIRGVLHELGQRGHALIDASSGKRVLWSEEVADAVEFLDRATVERKASAAARAREVKMLLGHTYIPQPKVLNITDAEARQMWFDRVRYPSQKEVAERCGVVPRTLYNRFGSRTPEAPLKRKARR